MDEQGEEKPREPLSEARVAALTRSLAPHGSNAAALIIAIDPGGTYTAMSGYVPHDGEMMLAIRAVMKIIDERFAERTAAKSSSRAPNADR